MEKISSIVGSSSAKVDMSKERPVRSGAPSFGRPVSEATRTFEAREKIAAEKNAEFQRTQLNSFEAPKDAFRHSGIIDKITLSFKGNPENAIHNETVDLTTTVENPKISSDNGGSPNGDLEGGSLSIYV